ncbi:MAG: TadE family protein [Pikeienuella sp.]
MARIREDGARRREMWSPGFNWMRRGAARRFRADRAGAATVDFIVSLPILLAVLVLTSEYGRVLQMRAVLDNAVADAARYLSRAPLDASGAAFPPGVIEIAEELISARINTRHLAISAPAIGEDGEFRTVRVSAAAGVEAPALGLLGLGGDHGEASSPEEIDGLFVAAAETVRYFGR